MFSNVSLKNENSAGTELIFPLNCVNVFSLGWVFWSIILRLVRFTFGFEVAPTWPGYYYLAKLKVLYFALFTQL